MTSLPRDPLAFAQRVAGMLKQLRPNYSVDLTGSRELLVNGRRLDLDNLFRMVAHEPERADEIVEHFLEQLFSGDGLELGDVDFEFARPRVMPRIQPDSIFEHLSRDLVAHVPFVNGTVIVFVIDLPQMTVSITADQMLRWGVGPDDLEQIARQNLEAYDPDTSFEVIESRDGGRAVVVAQQDGYDAARLLLGDLHAKLSPSLGGNFYVAVPARDMMIAFSTEPPAFVARLIRRIDEDHRRMPYPITPQLFYVTRDGVAGSVSQRDLGLAA